MSNQILPYGLQHTINHERSRELYPNGLPGLSSRVFSSPITKKEAVEKIERKV